MFLYHITQDLTHSGVFTPTLPSAVLHGEDSDTPRASAAFTMANCFSSMPQGGVNLDYTLGNVGNIFKVFLIDTEELHLKAILGPKELREQFGVWDAELASEHWILEPFTVAPEDTFYIQLHDYHEKDISFENGFYFEALERSGMEEEEFLESSEFNPDIQLNTFRQIVTLYMEYIPWEKLEERLQEMRVDLCLEE